MSDIARTREFFGPRAQDWETRFPDDGPLYERAASALALSAGEVALDAGCGTGRALPALRSLVEPKGLVIGVDVTLEMLQQVIRHGRGALARLLLADVMDLPIPSGRVDGIFAAGLLSHLTGPIEGLEELARVTRSGGRLVLFHPIGRAALARRHGHDLEESDVRAESNLRVVLDRTGWDLRSIEDGDDEYLAVAIRR